MRALIDGERGTLANALELVRYRFRNLGHARRYVEGCLTTSETVTICVRGGREVLFARSAQISARQGQNGRPDVGSWSDYGVGGYGGYLVYFILEHDIRVAAAVPGYALVESVSSEGADWVWLKLDFETVRAWLGY